jgi:thymidylate synthase (FAD)
MKLFRDASRFTILAAPQHPEQILELAGRTCYRSEDKITADSAAKFVKMLLKRGHESVIEHASMTVRFSDVSRAFTHEMVRHRLASFSQESTRYVKQNDLHFVMPPDKDSKELVFTNEWGEMGITLSEYIEVMEDFYTALLNAGWKPEDARQFLPIGTTSEIVVTANLREWRLIFKLRCSKRAHWEIRTVMRKLLAKCINEWPSLFEDLAPLLED